MDVTSLRLFSHGREAAGCANVNVYCDTEIRVHWSETREMTQCRITHTRITAKDLKMVLWFISVALR